MYIGKHLIDIKLMKTFLSKQNKKSFTRKEFIDNTRSTPYYFREMVRFGLILDTGFVYTSQRGSPIVYKLNEAFLTSAETNTYKLSSEDIEMLIENKSTRVKTLNERIAVMQTQVDSLKSEHDSLFKMKSNT